MRGAARHWTGGSELKFAQQFELKMQMWVMIVTDYYSSHKSVRIASRSLWWMLTTLFWRWPTFRRRQEVEMAFYSYWLLGSALWLRNGAGNQCISNIWDFSWVLKRIFASCFEKTIWYGLSSYSTALLFFKVLEKIVHDQIHGYLVGSAILNSRQGGYRRHNSK